MTTSIQNNKLEQLLDHYAEWREDRWRRCMEGNNRLQPEKEARLIRFFYAGMRRREIQREGFHFTTICRAKKRLADFLDKHPEFQGPVCKCGRELFHPAMCRKQFRPPAIRRIVTKHEVPGFDFSTIEGWGDASRAGWQNISTDPFGGA